MNKGILWMLLAALALASSGCAHHEQLEPLPVPPASAAVLPPPPPATAGSLWTERQGALFSDNKGRYLGDIITVAIFESASASNESTTQTSRDSSMNAGIGSLLGLERAIGRATHVDPSKLVDAQYGNEFSGAGKTTRKENLVATLSTQVM